MIKKVQLDSKSKIKITVKAQNYLQRNLPVWAAANNHVSNRLFL